MAASQKQIRHVTQKLENLEEERRELNGMLDTCVDKILTVGKSWVESQGSSNYSCEDISLILERTLTFLIGKSDELSAGLSFEVEAEIPSSIPQQSSAVPSESPPHVSKTLLAESSVRSSESSKPSVQPSDQVLAQIMDRLDNLENDNLKIKDLDQRLGHIETERRKVDREKVKEVERRLDHMDNSLKDLTTFAERIERMEERMNTLSGLDEELKKLQKERQVERKAVDDIRAVVTSLAAQLQLCKKQPVAVGFTAKTSGIVKFTMDTPVTGFTEILTNRGDHYNPSTGEFTAPVEGMYLSSLTHTQLGEGNRRLCVECERNKAGPGGEMEDMVCQTWTEVGGTSCTGVGVVYMSAGDRLYVKALSDGNIDWPNFYFTCCFIG